VLSASALALTETARNVSHPCWLPVIAVLRNTNSHSTLTGLSCRGPGEGKGATKTMPGCHAARTWFEAGSWWCCRWRLGRASQSATTAGLPPCLAPTRAWGRKRQRLSAGPPPPVSLHLNRQTRRPGHAQPHTLPLSCPLAAVVACP